MLKVAFDEDRIRVEAEVLRRLHAHLFPGGRGLRHAGGLRIFGIRMYQVRDPVARQPSPPGEDQLSPQASSWTPAQRGATVLCQFHLSGWELDQTAPGNRQGRMAFGRTVPSRRLHRDQHEQPGGVGGRLLQQARRL